MVIISLLWKNSWAKITKSIFFYNNCDKNIGFCVKIMTSGEAALARCHYPGIKMQNRSTALHIKMNIYIPGESFSKPLNLPLQGCRAWPRTVRCGSSPRCDTVRAATRNRQVSVAATPDEC